MNKSKRNKGKKNNDGTTKQKVTDRKIESVKERKKQGEIRKVKGKERKGCQGLIGSGLQCLPGW